jgi:hypothetical protein
LRRRDCPRALALLRALRAPLLEVLDGECFQNNCSGLIRLAPR